MVRLEDYVISGYKFFEVRKGLVLAVNFKISIKKNTHFSGFLDDWHDNYY